MENISAILQDIKHAEMAVPILPPIISPFNISFWPLQESGGSGRMRVNNYILYQVVASIAAATSGGISLSEQISMVSDKWQAIADWGMQSFVL